MSKICQIVLVGHTPQKLIFSIDKEIFDKLIFITEKETLPGSEKALETLEILLTEYKRRKIIVEHKKFSFLEPTKPVAELVHLVYQQKILGYDEIIINISGGLRYMDIWIYLAASITKSKIIHGDFIYEGDREVGIYKNEELSLIYLPKLTPKQIEFLELFFPDFNDPLEFFNKTFNFDENPLIKTIQSFESIEDLRSTLIRVRKVKLTRGAINGYIQKLSRIYALEITPESENKRRISIKYLGIAFFLKEMFKHHLQKNN